MVSTVLAVDLRVVCLMHVLNLWENVQVFVPIHEVEASLLQYSNILRLVVFA